MLLKRLLNEMQFTGGKRSEHFLPSDRYKIVAIDVHTTVLMRFRLSTRKRSKTAEFHVVL